MNYLSVCSGIEAASVAWEPLGWTPLAFAEIEAFPSAVLEHRWPGVPNLGDLTLIEGGPMAGQVDVLIGGTPCQAFSVAGKRESLGDERGALIFHFVRLVNEINPRVTLWENVPGALNTHDNAFGCFLGALAGEDDPLVPPGGKWSNAGYVLGPARAIAWRILDAQFFGVAQRRRRVFVVACPRNEVDPREILFEREGVRRDSPPSRAAGEGFAADVAPCLGASGRGVERTGETRGQDPVVAFYAQGGARSTMPGPTSPALKTGCGSNAGHQVAVAFSVRGRDGGAQAEVEPDGVCPALRGSSGGSRAMVGGTIPLVENEVSPTITSKMQGSSGWAPQNETAHLLAVAPRPLQDLLQVRRLTPRECERLQGFPDDYTRIPWRAPLPYTPEDDEGVPYRAVPAKECPDGPRYKALGNSMAVPVIRWLGERIQEALHD